MRKIILDTNFLLVPAEFGLDVYSELERLVPQKHELVTLPCVRAELENLTRKNKKLKLALSIMGSKGVRIEQFSMGSLKEPKETALQNPPNARFKKGSALKESDLCDEAVLSFAAAHNAIVCTLDRKLKLKARSNGIVVVHMVGRSHLGFFGLMED